MIISTDLKPMSPAEILKGFKTPDRVMNIAVANVRNPNSLSMLLDASIKRYEALTNEIERLEATLCVYDLEPKKVKVSKRVAKVPKYARSLTRARGQGNSFDVGGVKSRARAFASKVFA